MGNTDSQANINQPQIFKQIQSNNIEPIKSSSNHMHHDQMPPQTINDPKNFDNHQLPQYYNEQNPRQQYYDPAQQNQKQNNNDPQYQQQQYYQNPQSPQTYQQQQYQQPLQQQQTLPSGQPQLQTQNSQSDYQLFKIQNTNSFCIARQITDFNYEFEFRTSFTHPHLMQTYGFKPNESMLFFEYQEQSLKSMIMQRARNQIFTEGDVLALAQGVASALAYLQERDIIHGDICTENVYFCPSSGGFKIYDQELYAGKISGFQKTRKHIKKALLPPELLVALHNPNIQQLNENLYKADVFSLGLMILEVMTLTPSTEVYDPVTNALVTSVLEKKLKFATSYYSPEICHILRIMLDLDPMMRSDCIQIWGVLGQREMWSAKVAQMSQEAQQFIHIYKPYNQLYPHEPQQQFQFQPKYINQNLINNIQEPNQSNQVQQNTANLSYTEKLELEFKQKKQQAQQTQQLPYQMNTQDYSKNVENLPSLNMNQQQNSMQQYETPSYQQVQQNYNFKYANYQMNQTSLENENQPPVDLQKYQSSPSLIRNSNQKNSNKNSAERNSSSNQYSAPFSIPSEQKQLQQQQLQITESMQNLAINESPYKNYVQQDQQKQLQEQQKKYQEVQQQQKILQEQQQQQKLLQEQQQQQKLLQEQQQQQKLLQEQQQKLDQEQQQQQQLLDQQKQLQEQQTKQQQQTIEVKDKDKLSTQRKSSMNFQAQKIQDQIDQRKKNQQQIIEKVENILKKSTLIQDQEEIEKKIIKENKQIQQKNFKSTIDKIKAELESTKKLMENYHSKTEQLKKDLV